MELWNVHMGGTVYSTVVDVEEESCFIFVLVSLSVV